MHVVIIGAGIGGLAAAIRLACAGLRVTLCEASAAVGGKLGAVEVAGRPVDVGPTVFTMRDVFDALFEAAGETLDDHLTLRRSETIARHIFADGARLDLYADQARSEEAIAAFAGEDAARDYAGFCDRAADIYATLSPIFIRAERPSGPFGLALRAGPSGLPGLLRIGAQTRLAKSLSQQFADPRLAQLFARYATYNGSSPYLAPATLMLIAHVEKAGVWLVEGGMTQLAAALRGLAERCGVTVRCGASVASIDTVQGRASGVSLVGGETIAADIVVSNADVGALASGRFGEAAAASVDPPLASAERSLSAVTVAFEAPTCGLTVLRHNVFFSADYRREFDEIVRERRLPSDPTVYLCASDRDDHGALAEPARRRGRERLFLIINAPADGDGPDFDKEEVERCVTAAFSRLRASALQVERPDWEAIRLSTPSDFERRFPATGGALYGRASHGSTASFQRPGARTKLPGLYLCGGSVHPGAGLPMAALSGRIAAEAILADRASTRRFRRAAMPGGMWTRSRPTATMPSR
ncbi:phytoene desaturase [Jiella sp. MQZ9-1]|uniref:Phytoene desaturase n=1 Tax=Jiella flava TaxID=2816857 RepID=A0A939FTN6_9HYPH|nr:1-hydroxycarotenoid 3,4-desaturase CrtD [Jiella flava]MBO0661748.1 phytoene desaturase [Jiella flava]MCD2470389.1 phytoene desaturase [Jiella flava]